MADVKRMVTITFGECLENGDAAPIFPPRGILAQKKHWGVDGIEQMINIEGLTLSDLKGLSVQAVTQKLLDMGLGFRWQELDQEDQTVLKMIFAD